ncbi:hypothetical protein M513_14159 [Trichuris suis]|uniref:Uncharacterized protein n=1 Tax=Trichuris suis TaxID=68888 RepID=A0A085LJ18_9BILA|nr:hypothetical protein M513_14159 [Trichuris suis]
MGTAAQRPGVANTFLLSSRTIIHCANVQCTRSHILPAPHVRLRDPAIAAQSELHHSIQYGSTGPATQAHGARMIDVRGRNDAYRNHQTPYRESVQRESCTLPEYLCMCTQETARVPANRGPANGTASSAWWSCFGYCL